MFIFLELSILLLQLYGEILTKDLLTLSPDYNHCPQSDTEAGPNSFLMS